MSVVVIDLVDGADVGMVQLRSGAGFPLEAVQRLLIAGHIVRNKLEGYVTAQACVFSFIDDPHTSAPKLTENAVVGDRLADHGFGRHRGTRIAIGVMLGLRGGEVTWGRPFLRHSALSGPPATDTTPPMIPPIPCSCCDPRPSFGRGP